MGLEIVGSRVLAPVFGTSLFVWGALITTFLAALALGYALGGRLADRRPDPGMLAALLAGSGIVLFVVFASPDALLAALGRAPIPDRFRALVAAVVLFGPPSVLMGMVTPFAVRLAAKEIATVGSASGRLSALSTAGSILGTFATAFFLIPGVRDPADPLRPRRDAPRRLAARARAAHGRAARDRRSSWLGAAVAYLVVSSGAASPGPGRDGRLREGDGLSPSPRRRRGAPALALLRQPHAGLRPRAARPRAAEELHGRHDARAALSGPPRRTRS